MKFYVSDKFTSLQNVILRLTAATTGDLTVMQDNRNIVSKAELTEGTFVIKDFRGMYFVNRLAYSFFRKSKAVRSFEHSERLNKMGILTPEPVAWIDEYTSGFLQRSVFISTFFPHQTLGQFLANIRESEWHIKRSVLQHLAIFAIDLHRKGVYHDDFSVGNIFVIPTPRGYDFALTDLNRMRFFKSISFEKAMGNFRKIQFNSDDLRVFITEYARLSSRDPEAALAGLLKLKYRSSKLRQARRKLRSYTIGLIESLRAPNGSPATPVAYSRIDTPDNQIQQKHELQNPHQQVAKNAVPQPHEEHPQFADRPDDQRHRYPENSDHPSKSPSGKPTAHNSTDSGGVPNVSQGKGRSVR